jgi:hypothetical protein
MAQKCGFPNRTRPWSCRHRVNYPPCWQHRGGLFAFFSPISLLRSPSASSPPPSAGQHQAREETEASATTLLADLLADGVRPTLADRVSERVVQYLGWPGAKYQRYRRRWWTDVDCQLLADTARAVLDLGRRSHELVAMAVDKLLPPETPRFHRNLVKKIAAKLPLPWDVKLAAIARGLQVFGIWMCMLQDRLEHCACLRMLGPQLVKEQVKRYIEDLLKQTERDLKGES